MDDAQILEREIAKLGAAGGFVGGLVPGAIGGYAGGKFAARFLPTETRTRTIEIRARPEDVLRAAFEILTSIGRLTDELAVDSGVPRLAAITGSGHANLNPTVVAVAVNPGAAGDCTVTITGTAKEGLIKQHSAEKAVARLEDQLRRAFPDAAV